jgi:hypothetical protein
MADLNPTDRRVAALDRRHGRRAIRCEHCQALLSFDRRGCVVGMYRSASAMPVHAGLAAREQPSSAVQPRCAICQRSLLPAAQADVAQDDSAPGSIRSSMAAIV